MNMGNVWHDLMTRWAWSSESLFQPFCAGLCRLEPDWIWIFFTVLSVELVGLGIGDATMAAYPGVFFLFLLLTCWYDLY